MSKSSLMHQVSWSIACKLAWGSRSWEWVRRRWCSGKCCSCQLQALPRCFWVMADRSWIPMTLSRDWVAMFRAQSWLHPFGCVWDPKLPDHADFQSSRTHALQAKPLGSDTPPPPGGEGGPQDLQRTLSIRLAKQNRPHSWPYASSFWFSRLCRMDCLV